jgi:hypothetical protein
MRKLSHKFLQNALSGNVYEISFYKIHVNVKLYRGKHKAESRELTAVKINDGF